MRAVYFKMFFTVLLLLSFIQGWSGLHERRRGSVFSHRWRFMYENLTMLNLQNSSNWTGPNNWYHPADTINPQHGTSMWTYLCLQHLSMWTYTVCVYVCQCLWSQLWGEPAILILDWAQTEDANSYTISHACTPTYKHGSLWPWHPLFHYGKAELKQADVTQN